MHNAAELHRTLFDAIQARDFDTLREPANTTTYDVMAMISQLGVSD